MKRFIHTTDIYLSNKQKDVDSILGMANLSSKRSGLPVTIWSDGSGSSRKMKHNVPRLKIGKQGQFGIVVSIEPEPKILRKSKGIKDNEVALCKSAIEYVGRNYDLFLKHFNSNDDEFDDQDLFDALRERGQYK